MSNVLELNNVNKSFKDFGLKDISFELKKGYIMGFIGPNGSGKTTTIKLIMHLLNKDSGDIKVFGKDHLQYEREIKDRIGFVYDECYFYENLSIKDNGKILGPFYSKWNNELFYEYLERFELNPKKKIAKLSKGMKTKFQLAFALSHKADLLIMDEPTAGLDPIFRREFLELLHDLMQDENKSIFFSTHITSDLDRIADYVTIINEGSIVFSTSMEELKETYHIIKGSNELLNSIDKDMLDGLKQTSFCFEALTMHSKTLSRQLGDRIVIEKPSLEDIMVFSKSTSVKER
ncbi:MAG: ABC transporter ATP-binding protein [Eubacteriales bacterium]